MYLVAISYYEILYIQQRITESILTLLSHYVFCSLFTSLGSGQFGAVYRGAWRHGQEEVAVAVKTLKEGASEEDRVKFLQEAAIMGQFKHTNVVTMFGVIKEEEPVNFVLEINGSYNT